MEILYTIGAKIIKGFRQLKVSVDDKPYNCMQVTPYGHDGIPINGLNAVKTNTKSKSVVIGYIQKAIDGLNKGDTIEFCKDSEGAVKAKIIHRTDDVIEMLGTGDFMIRYNEMESAYNEMKADMNNIITQFNAHIHLFGPSPTGIPVAIPSKIPILPSTATMTNAKHESIKTTEKA